MSPSSDSPAPDRPAATDPYSYFAVRGVSREALRDFFEAEVERSVRSDRVEGSPIAELYRLLGLDWMVALVALLGGTESYAPWSADAAVGKCRRYQPSCASCSSSTMAAAGSRPLH